MLEKTLVKLKANKITLILAGVAILFLVLGYVGYQRLFAANSQKTEVAGPETDLSFDPNGPYAILSPRRDGNALVLNIKRTASYKQISYDLAYSDDGGIDRGVSGDIDTSSGKAEYSQEILFGTCSKNVCKYDQGVENGTLTLHITKDNQRYRMLTSWHLQKPELALGKLASGDNHFMYTLEMKSTTPLPEFTIINELTGIPKLPDAKKVVGKVYALNSTSGSTLPKGALTVELADNPPADSKIYLYSESENKWNELSVNVAGSTLKTNAPSGGIFAVLATIQ